MEAVPQAAGSIEFPLYYAWRLAALSCGVRADLPSTVAGAGLSRGEV
jgi:hypothetical protein